jgi:hypothetical protein
MTFVGYEITIRTARIWVRAKAKSRAKLLLLIIQVIETDHSTFATYEKLLGLLTHASTVIKLWRVWSTPIYAALQSYYHLVHQGRDRLTLMVQRTEIIIDKLMMIKAEIDYNEPFKRFSWAPWLLAAQEFFL